MSMHEGSKRAIDQALKVINLNMHIMSQYLDVVDLNDLHFSVG